MTVGLILCAGKGVRMAPFSEFIPKPLLPINRKALISWNIDILVQTNLTNIGIVVNQANKTIIRQYIEEKYKNTEIDLFVQENQLGIVDAIKSAKKYRNNDIITIAGDTLFSTKVFKLVLEPIITNNASITVGIHKRSVNQIKRRSNIQLDQEDKTKIINVIEKPELTKIHSKWCGAPIWAFKSDIWEYLDISPLSNRGEYDISETINLLIEKGLTARGIEVPPCPDLTYPIDILKQNFPYINSLLKDS
jgi:dTDP-glucose pyrophosphorylase